MLESCKKSNRGDIIVSKWCAETVLEENFKNPVSPAKYINSFKLYSICRKNADLSWNRNSDIQGLSLKKNPNQLPKKRNNRNFKGKIENDAVITPFTLLLSLQWWLQYV